MGETAFLDRWRSLSTGPFRLHTETGYTPTETTALLTEEMKERKRNKREEEEEKRMRGAVWA